VSADLTLSDLVTVFLQRHSVVRSERTVQTLRERLARPRAAYGDLRLRDLERMAGDLADFSSTLPAGYRYAVMSALRQCLGAGVRWGYLSSNPAAAAGPNPMPQPRAIRVFSAAELDAISAELSDRDGALVRFAAATGLRPSEWASLERRDLDRRGRIATVRGTKTAGSRRDVPLSARALDALALVRRSSERRSCSLRRRAAGSTSTTSAAGRGGIRARREVARSRMDRGMERAGFEPATSGLQSRIGGYTRGPEFPWIVPICRGFSLRKSLGSLRFYAFPRRSRTVTGPSRCRPWPELSVSHVHGQPQGTEEASQRPPACDPELGSQDPPPVSLD
jgi:integrase